MKVREARKILKDKGIQWSNLFDLRPYESDYRDDVRLAVIRLVKYIYNGNAGDY